MPHEHETMEEQPQLAERLLGKGQMDRTEV